MIHYRSTISVLLLIFFSCRNGHPVSAVRDTAKIAAKDIAGDTTAVDDELEGYPVKRVEQGRLELPDYVITLVTRYAIVNGIVDTEAHSVPPESCFICLNKKTGKADTIETSVEEDPTCVGCQYPLKDMTDSFQIKPFIVQFASPGEDIYTDYAFIGYQDGKFKQLFGISDIREGGIKLHREGSKLVGFVSGRDEVVENVEEDYLLEVDTKTFEVTQSSPDKQNIDYTTTVTEPFRAHRVIDGRVDGSLVAVKKGAKVNIDTIYRTSGKVRLHVSDSVIVEVKIETAKEKLDHNHAG